MNGTDMTAGHWSAGGLSRPPALSHPCGTISVAVISVALHVYIVRNCLNDTVYGSAFAAYGLDRQGAVVYNLPSVHTLLIRHVRAAVGLRGSLLFPAVYYSTVRVYCTQSILVGCTSRLVLDFLLL